MQRISSLDIVGQLDVQCSAPQEHGIEQLLQLQGPELAALYFKQKCRQVLLP